MCEGCHGIPGYKTAFPSVYNVPKLGGQHPGYIAKALQAYKSGERSHPSMRGIAASLSDKDMADLKIWNHGTFTGNYSSFHARIRAGMPASQSPNLFVLGKAGAFLTQTPFSV